MRFKFAWGTDVGRKRKQNQDNGGAYSEMGLFVVADGMGGHRGGETASKLACEAIPAEMSRRVSASAPISEKPTEDIREAIRAANVKIFETARENPDLQGMGTTTTAMLFGRQGGKDHLSIGHVGDSRCYYLRPDSIWQLTRDHSLVQEKLRAGLITREQAKTDRMKNVITRSVGFEPVVEVDVYEVIPQMGDVFLACSDGLSGLIEDREILARVQKTLFSGLSPEQCVASLIEGANDRGGDDNITALIVQYLGT